jgi:disulfide oxidoreductase YuzD
MTDNDIVKAIRVCADDEAGCGKCPFFKNGCTSKMLAEADELINRQRTDYAKLQNAYVKGQELFSEQCLENERLKAEIDMHRKHDKKILEKINEIEKLFPVAISISETKAITVFAERLKEIYTDKFGTTKESLVSFVCQREIDSLVEKIKEEISCQ